MCGESDFITELLMQTPEQDEPKEVSQKTSQGLPDNLSTTGIASFRYQNHR